MNLKPITNLTWQGHNLTGYQLAVLQHRMAACKVPQWSRICRLRRKEMPKVASLSTPLLFLLSLSLSPSPSSFSSHCPPLSLLFLLLIIASLRLAEYLKGGGRRVNVCSSKGTHDTLKDDMAVCKGISSLPPPFLSSFSVTPVFSSPHRGDGRGHNSVQAGQSVMS